MPPKRDWEVEEVGVVLSKDKFNEPESQEASLRFAARQFVKDKQLILGHWSQPCERPDDRQDIDRGIEHS